MKKIPLVFILSLCLVYTLSLSSCYRFPTDEDLSVVPATNNPDVTRAGPENFMPNMGF